MFLYSALCADIMTILVNEILNLALKHVYCYCLEIAIYSKSIATHSFVYFALFAACFLKKKIK